MSVDNVIQALALVDDSDDCDITGPQSDSLIAQAEELLGFAFPADYRLFLSRVGYLSYGGLEIFGITGSDLLSPSVPNGIWYTLDKRRSGMANDLILVGHSELGCPAIRASDATEASPIVLYYLGFPEDSQTYEVIATDFGSYLLEQIGIIKEELDSL